METRNFDREARMERRFQTLGTRTPRCPCCSESTWNCFQVHHIAQAKYMPDVTIIVCLNCHRKLSEMQEEHPMFDKNADPFLQSLVHFLLGLADMFELAIEKLREFASALMQRAREVGPVGEGE